MNTPKELTLPISKSEILELRAGDIVTLTGAITLTMGIPTHQRMIEFLNKGQDLPVDLNSGAFFHLPALICGEDGSHEFVYLNPTTSTRFNPYMPQLVRDLNLTLIGGKGGLDMATTKAMQDAQCVYLSFLGGGSTLLSEAVKDVVSVEWTDLLPHYRLTTLRVEQLGPVTVGIDAHGTNLYEELKTRAAQNLPDILNDLAAAREQS